MVRRVCLSEGFAHEIFIHIQRSCEHSDPVTFISVQKIGKLNFTGYLIREESMNRTDFGTIWSKPRSSGAMCSFSWKVRLILKDHQGKALFWQAQMFFAAIKLTSEGMQYMHLLKEIQGMDSHLIHVKRWGKRLGMGRTVSGIKRNCRNGSDDSISLVCVCAQCNRFMSSEEEPTSLSRGFYK